LAVWPRPRTLELIQIKEAEIPSGIEPPVDHSLHVLAALCAAPGLPHPVDAGLLLGLAAAGASGSLVHCVPMCGPFVLGQVSDRLACLPVHLLCQARRLRSGALLPYHLGRLTTYAALGAIAALAGGGVARLPWLGRFAGVFLLLGAILFLGQLVRALRLRPAMPAGWTAAFGRLAAQIDCTRPAGGFLCGLLLGLLPCGLLYAALAVAAAATPWGGAARMLAFGLGTVPALVTVGVAGPAFGLAAQRGLIAIGRPVMAANAVVLAALAIDRLAG
jgi:sulfite exporter TauE/SafE